ncbi:hypothetical protein PG984_011941 [Apiospora sp. TS-2023a]
MEPSRIPAPYMEPTANCPVPLSTPLEASMPPELGTLKIKSPVPAKTEPEHDPDTASDHSSQNGDLPDPGKDEKKSTSPPKRANRRHGLVSKPPSLWCPKTSRSHASFPGDYRTACIWSGYAAPICYLKSVAKSIVKSYVRDPIFRIRTVVQTNIKEDFMPHDRERVARRIMSEGILRNPKYDVEVISEDIKILSRRIIDVLKQLTTYYPGMVLTGDDVTLEEPYVFAFHNLEKIKSYQQDRPDQSDAAHPNGYDEETRRQLRVLCDAVELKHGMNVEQEMARYAAPTPKATFKMLWLLFKPGETVYTRVNGGWQACVVKEVDFEHHTVCKLSSSYTLDLWHLDFDGRRLGRCKCVREIVPFDGEMEIVSLGTFPAQYLDKSDGGKTRQRLEARGEKFYKYLNIAHVHYSGESLGPEARQVSIERGFTFNRVRRRNGRWSRDSSPSSSSSSSSSDNDNEVTIKAQGAKFLWRMYDNIDPKETPNLDVNDCKMGQSKKHRYLLCPNRVIEQLNIECCHEPRSNRSAIDTLVMSEERKTMMKALVYRYTDRSSEENKGAAPWAADFIENKGDGQIFLLHGSPGVGKTYDILECIAESTGRPLLSLTCGDIGNDEEKLESRLSKWFRLAEIWGAVMLLDEADVFLERRATSDLHRNSLVTVFLRSMEYYRGILFLTTNRVGHFDDAFISRVHVVLRYENLTNTDRERIWNQFFDKLKRERGKYIEISREAKRYVLKDSEMTSIPWNGREIRNTFQTAVALAEYRFVQSENKEDGDKASLDWDDFEKVCRMTGAFKGYLQSVHDGADESQRAFRDVARNDAFVESIDEAR